ncbi:hypothetical protein QQ045_005298 [Rhodiola kirilowii]
MWSEVENLSKTFVGSRLYMGDFIYVLRPSEKLMGLALFVENCDLGDIEGCGCHFTWSNNNMLPEKRIWYHCPIVVSWGCKPSRVSQFRYCNFWERLDDYKEKVTNCWSSDRGCNNLFMVQAKLNIIKKMMKSEFMKVTKGMDGRVENLRRAPTNAQKLAEHCPMDAALAHRELEMAREYRKIKGGGESGRKIDGSQCRAPIREVTDMEIWNALNKIGVDKSSGPDGFSSSFFKTNCDILGNEFLTSVRHCLKNNALPRGMNVAFIALIPKTKLAAEPVDYRPISCCNVVYKVISGVLADRLKGVLPEIVDLA